MDGEERVCRSCGKGRLTSEIVEDIPNGAYVVTSVFSCGHKHVAIKIEEKITLDETHRVKLRSGEKVRGKPIREMEENFQGGDRDNPKEKVIKTYYWIRSNDATHVLQTVQYGSGKLKHIHCKKCGNEWKINSSRDLDKQFIYELPEKRRIVCLQCGATFEE